MTTTAPPNRIRSIRKGHKLTLKQLAGNVNRSITQISDLERGKRGLTLDWMRELSVPLRSVPADLLADEDNPDRLNDEERKLVDAFRRGDARKRLLIITYLDLLALSVATERQDGPTQ